jgi:hypothetical protein
MNVIRYTPRHAARSPFATIVRHTATTAAVLLTILTGILLLSMWQEQAHAEGVGSALSVERWVQPYGGCEEATLAPQSAAADECRDHGWTIRRRLAVSGHGIVKGSGLPHCREEDGSDRVHYVWVTSPMRDGWHWANAAQTQMMGRSRSDCIVKDGTTIAVGLVARCPG